MSTVTAELQGPQISASYRDYSPEFKAASIAAYEANECNLTATAKKLGIAFQTLDYWIKTARRNSEFQNHVKADLASECEEIAYKVAGIAKSTLDDPDKAGKIPFAALMTGGAVAIDKMLLLRGQPTSINLNVNRDDLFALLQQSLEDID